MTQTIAHLMFVQAQRFHSASNMLATGPLDVALERHALPSMFTSYVASEIYLKLLNFLHSGQRLKGHNLRVLFEQLPPPMRSRIRKKWKILEASIPPPPAEITQGLALPTTLEDSLEAAASFYETSRYLWEKNDNEVVTIHQLPVALRQAVLEMYPHFDKQQPS